VPPGRCFAQRRGEVRSTDCLVLRQHVLHHRDVGVSKDTQPCVLVLFGGDGKHAPVWLLREREAVQNQSFREPHMFFFKRQSSQCRFALRLRCQEVYCALPPSSPRRRRTSQQ
jgi:hypothetical protein